MHQKLSCTPLVILLGPSLLFSTLTAMADDFRVDSKVYSSGQRQPDSRGVTIFHNGLVYDFLESPAEVIVLDRAAGRFAFLDLTRRLQTELTTREVAAFADRLKQGAAEHQDLYINFLADPQFKEGYDAKPGMLTLGSRWMTYQARLVTPPSAAISAQYREFSDWYAQLNTLLHTGSRPASARLKLNEAIARHQTIAREVVLTMEPREGAGAKRTTIRSEHQLTLPLAKADVDRVAQTRQFMAGFKAVSFKEYRSEPER